MAQRNVEWYSVHTNGLALREMAQRNVECYSVDTNSVALCRIALQNIRRSIWTLNCLVLLEIFRSCGESSSLLVAWREGYVIPYYFIISYAILQLILKPSLYLLIYFTSLYFLVVSAAKAISPKPPKLQTANGTAICWEYDVIKCEDCRGRPANRGRIQSRFYFN